MDWPYEDTGETRKTNGGQSNIAHYLAENMFDLVINLPLRNSGSYRASSFVTQGYKTRRMAVDYCVPLLTDVKCTKMFVEVCVKFAPRSLQRFEICTKMFVEDCMKFAPRCLWKFV